MRAREDQIEGLASRIQRGCPDLELSRTLAKNYVEEIEQRVRAEIGRDSERLEWLEKLPFADVGRLPNGWEICINNVRHWDVQPTLRAAIDAAMEGGK